MNLDESMLFNMASEKFRTSDLGQVCPYDTWQDTQSL